MINTDSTLEAVRVEILSAVSHISLVDYTASLAHLLTMPHVIDEDGELIDVIHGEWLLVIPMVHGRWTFRRLVSFAGVACLATLACS